MNCRPPPMVRSLGQTDKKLRQDGTPKKRALSNPTAHQCVYSSRGPQHMVTPSTIGLRPRLHVPFCGITKRGQRSARSCRRGIRNDCDQSRTHRLVAIGNCCRRSSRQRLGRPRASRTTPSLPNSLRARCRAHSARARFPPFSRQNAGLYPPANRGIVGSLSQPPDAYS